MLGCEYGGEGLPSLAQGTIPDRDRAWRREERLPATRLEHVLRREPDTAWPMNEDPLLEKGQRNEARRITA